MGLEVTTTIDGLNELFPLGGDNGSVNAAHLRLIKDVVKKTLRGDSAGGWDGKITATAAELSFVLGLTSLLQTQLLGFVGKGVMLDGVIMYSGVYSAIPSNYFVCDGLNGTVDLRNKFIYGTNTEANIGVEGGTDDSVNVTHDHQYDHAHTAQQTSSGGLHFHTVNADANAGAKNVGELFGKKSAGSIVVTALTEGNHTHVIAVDNNTDPTSTDGVSGTGLNRPGYYTLAYIQRKT